MMRVLILLAALLFGQTYPAPGPGRNAYNAVTPITYTTHQCSVYGGATAISTENCTLTVANTGDTLLVFVSGSKGSAFNLNSATAGCGTGTVLRASLSFAGGTFYNSVASIPNATAGSCTVTITLSATALYLQEWVVDFAGANTATPVDNASCTSTPYCTATGTAAAITSGSITTSNPNEMLVAWTSLGTTNTLSNRSGSPFTYVQFPANAGGGIAYGIETLAGSYTVPFTQSTTGYWGSTVVALTH
jgi:hypothetical protein